MKEYLINKKLSEYGKTKMYKTKIHLGKKEKMNSTGKYIKNEKSHNSKEMKKENTASQKNELENSKKNMDEDKKVNEGETKDNQAIECEKEKENSKIISS